MILVDGARFSRGNRRNWCHMMSDMPNQQEAIQELHEFAQRIGLRRSWFQSKSSPHYDLSPSFREKALRRGAQEVTSQEMVQRCILIHRQRGTATDDPERVIVPLEEAIRRLPDEETIYVVSPVSGGRIHLGASWPREELIEALREHGVEESGPVAKSEGFGMVFHDGHGWLFIKTKGEARSAEPANQFEQMGEALSQMGEALSQMGEAMRQAHEVLQRTLFYAAFGMYPEPPEPPAKPLLDDPGIINATARVIDKEDDGGEQ